MFVQVTIATAMHVYYVLIDPQLVTRADMSAEWTLVCHKGCALLAYATMAATEYVRRWFCPADNAFVLVASLIKHFLQRLLEFRVCILEF